MKCHLFNLLYPIKDVCMYRFQSLREQWKAPYLSISNQSWGQLPSLWQKLLWTQAFCSKHHVNANQVQSHCTAYNSNYLRVYQWEKAAYQAMHLSTSIKSQPWTLMWYKIPMHSIIPPEYYWKTLCHHSSLVLSSLTKRLRNRCNNYCFFKCQRQESSGTTMRLSR